MALMFIYAVLTALFFTLLWKEPQDRKRFFLIVFCSLFFGGIVAGWVMYPWPLR
jgi:uncharacterized membrane protein